MYKIIIKKIKRSGVNNKNKKKFEKAKILLQLRERQAFIKPSIRRRGQVLKAVYKQQIASGKIES